MQPLCRQGNTFFFAAVDGIPAQYEIVLPDGRKETVTAAPGLDSAFCTGASRIITLTWAQAKYLRRLGDTLYIGDSVNLYMLDGELYAIEEGAFSCFRYGGSRFERMEFTRSFSPAVLTLMPVAEPFVPPYARELNLRAARSRFWQKMHVSTPEGFVTIDGEYDAAQIYADGQLIADHFYTGVAWRVPARLLFGHECYLVMSERKDDFYCEC